MSAGDSIWISQVQVKIGRQNCTSACLVELSHKVDEFVVRYSYVRLSFSGEVCGVYIWQGFVSLRLAIGVQHK